MSNAYFAYINSCNKPLPNGTVVMFPVQAPTVSGSAIVIGDPVTTTTDLNGIATFPNIVLSNYFKLDFKVVRDTTTFYCYLPTSSLDLDGADYAVSCSINNGNPTSVYFSLVDCTGHFWAVKNVVLSPIYYPNINDSRITTRDEITLATTLNGTVTFPTVIPGTYMVTCNGHRRSTVFFIQVPSSGGTVNAKDIMVLPTSQQLQVINIPAGSSFATGLTESEADLLYQKIIQSGSYFDIFVANATNSDTASYVAGALSSTSASYAVWSDFAGQSDSASYSIFAVNANTASVSDSASYAVNTDTASISTSSSYTPYADTSSYVQLAESASYTPYADTASYAISASVADTSSFSFVAVSSSYAPVDLSNVGSASWASSSILADVAVSASYSPWADFTLSSSYADMAVEAFSASYASNSDSASHALIADVALNVPMTASNADTASVAFSSSYSLFADTSTSASYAATASVALNVPLTASNADTASFAFNAVSASYADSSSFSPGSISSSYALSASHALIADVALNVPVTASYANFATSASNSVSASYALNVPITASFAVSASHANWSDSAVSASYAVSYSYTFVTVNQYSSSYASGSTSASYSEYSDTASHAMRLQDNPTFVWEPVFSGPKLKMAYAPDADGGGILFVDTVGNQYFGIVANTLTPIIFYTASQFNQDVTINGHTYGIDADFMGVLFGDTIYTNKQYFNGIGGAVTIENDYNGGFLFTVGGAHQVQIDKHGAIDGAYLSGSADFAVSASYASQVSSASYATTASYALNGGGAGSVSASFADTSSYAFVANISLNSGPSISASYAATASVALNSVPSVSASYAFSASYASNASYTVTLMASSSYASLVNPDDSILFFLWDDTFMIGNFRITEDGDNRITEDGNYRILEG